VKVAELISKLKDYPQDMIVNISINGVDCYEEITFDDTQTFVVTYENEEKEEIQLIIIGS
jgi:hypothetical protein